MPVLAAIPPAEHFVRLPAPKFPGPVEMLVAVNDGHLFLEWYIVQRLMEGMEPAFAHMEGAKTLAQWAAVLAPGLRLRESDLSLETRAVRIEHPALPKGRYYFLIAGNPDYPITFLDPSAPEPDGTYIFRRWHIATLNVGVLFPHTIVSLVFETFSLALLSAERGMMLDFEHAFKAFGRQLRTLFTARGMKW
ncbi:MAG: hypothetical protein Q7S52_00790 [bacterium]|nr:hypothetical protein [bacterium]